MDTTPSAPAPASEPARPAVSALRPTLLETLHRHGLRILRNALIVTVVIALASLLVPNQYTAATQLLPPSETGEFTSLFSGMSEALALTRAFGLGRQGGTDAYLGVLRSGTVNRHLVERFDLRRVYRARDVEKAGRILRAHTAISLTNERLIRVAVTERDRRLAADLANAYAAELDHFMRLNMNTAARQRRVFIGKRLEETRQALASAEDSLQRYQVAGHLPSVGGDVVKTAEVVGELMGAKVTREVELGTLEDVARGANARADQLRAEIRQIDAQISQLPPVATRLGRLYRNVSIHEKVLLVLTEEYERARMLELKNIPTVEVVDVAEAPLHKSQPKRSFIVLGAFVIAFAAGAALQWIRNGALRAA